MQSPVLVLLFCLVAVALATPHDPIGKNETRSDAQENPLMERYSGCSGDETNPGVCLHCCGEGQTKHRSGRRNCRRRNICCVDAAPVCDGSTCGDIETFTGTCVDGDGCPAGTFSAPDSKCAATCSCCGSCPWPITSVGCILVVETATNWDTARSMCKEMGGDLVAPDSPEEFDAFDAYLLLLGGSEIGFWTSATNNGGVWKYAANDRVLGDAGQSTDWAAGQPDTLGTGELQCGIIKLDIFNFLIKLFDDDCGANLNFICEIK